MGDEIEIVQKAAWYGVFVLSVTLHECAHAWAARRGGDLTAYSGGQVSLDPTPHIKREPFGMVVLPIISLFLMGWPFGYASTPYDPYWAARHPRRASWMAAAGPAANLLLVLIAAALIRGGLFLGLFLLPSSIDFGHVVEPVGNGMGMALARIIGLFFTMNLVMTVLNLIPFPPLDGSGIICLFLSEETARKYQSITRNPTFALLGLLLAWRIFNPIFQAVFLVAIRLLYPEGSYS